MGTEDYGFAVPTGLGTHWQYPARHSSGYGYPGSEVRVLRVRLGPGVGKPRAASGLARYKLA
eukprot:355874-Rhodomonas_salina.2